MSLNIIKTALPGVLIIEPIVFNDQRGYFCETYNKARYEVLDIPGNFSQDNLSRSIKGVLRGLHYQLNYPQGKLVSVLNGSIFDVAVDIRPNSSTFKQWVGVELNEKNHRQIYIPQGYAHGFLVLSNEAYVYYKCTDYYHPEDEFGLIWSDPGLNICWPFTEHPLVSGKDATYPSINKIDPKNLPFMI